MPDTKGLLATGILTTTLSPLYTVPDGYEARITMIKMQHLDAGGANCDVALQEVSDGAMVRYINGKAVTYLPGYFSEDDSEILLRKNNRIDGVASAASLVSYSIEGVVSKIISST